MDLLKGRVAIVTGASKGIGLGRLIARRERLASRRDNEAPRARGATTETIRTV